MSGGETFFNSKKDKPQRKKSKRVVPLSQRAKGNKPPKKKQKSKRKQATTQQEFSNRVRRRVNFSLEKLGFSPNHLLFLWLGYTEKVLCNHLSKYLDKPCKECGVITLNLRTATIDHIVPVSIANGIQDIFELNQINNLRLICKSCNSRKGSKLPDEEGA